MSLQKMNFLFITPYTYPDNAGSGLNAFHLAEFLNQNKINVKVLTLNRNLKLKKKEKVNQIPIFRITYFNSNKITKLISFVLFIIPRYIQFLYSADVTFIFGAQIIGFEFIIILCKLFRTKVIFRSTLIKTDDYKTLLEHGNYFKKKFYKWLMKHLDIYHSINKTFTKYYLEKIKQPEKKLIQLPQGVNFSLFHPVSNDAKAKLKKELGLPVNKFIVLSVGFLINRKKYDEIFEVLENINFSFLYLVAGDYKVNKDHFLYPLNAEMNRLHNLGKEKLDNKIRFEGFQSNIVKYLQAADILLHNARREGLPNVILEAMSCGLLVITRYNEGLDDFILKHNYNALVYSTNEELKRLINDVYKKTIDIDIIKQNARSFIEQACSFDVVSKKLFKKLQDL